MLWNPQYPDLSRWLGCDTEEFKERTLLEFAHGKLRVLISKPSICGFGLNFQAATNQAFVGVTDSFEAYYQAVRRSWRFGQKSPVNVHVFASNQEGAVVANLRRKEAIANAMADAMAAETLEASCGRRLSARRKTRTSINLAADRFAVVLEAS